MVLCNRPSSACTATQLPWGSTAANLVRHADPGGHHRYGAADVERLRVALGRPKMLRLHVPRTFRRATGATVSCCLPARWPALVDVDIRTIRR